MKKELAQSAVEFALALPFLSWVLFGTVDFARIFYLQMAVVNAAHTGAQYALDSRHTATDVRSIISQESAPLITIDPNNISLTTTPSWSPGSQLKVEVSQPFTAFTPFVSAVWGGGVKTVKGSSVVRFNP